MPDVCFYFQVHQPWCLRRYCVFDIGRSHDYFDDVANEAILHGQRVQAPRRRQAQREPGADGARAA